MPAPAFAHRSLLAAVAAIGLVVLVLVAVGWGHAEGRSQYELVKDLFVPLVGPMVAVLIPVLVLYVLPLGQSRQKLALDLCAMYNTEEMRDARNVGWRHFVVEHRLLPDDGRAARLGHFLGYLGDPEAHRTIDYQTDAVYQKACRVLDFFALVDGCVARGVADPDMVREFLLFYYLWWRDEILDPLRAVRPAAAGMKYPPAWWKPLTHLDALARPTGPAP